MTAKREGSARSDDSSGNGAGQAPARRRDRIVLVEGKRRDISDLAWSDGQKLIPSPEALEVGKIESTIIEHWLGPYRDLNEVSNHKIKEYDKTFALNEKIAGQREVDQLVAQTRQAIPKTLGAARDRLTLLREVERGVFDERKSFREEHRLHRIAHFPESAWNHFAIIIAIVLIESFANMYFFAQGNSLGYLGGLLQSVLLSLINVGVAVAVGRFVLRALNHGSIGFKVGGSLAVIGYVVFLVVFNLVVGHYRDLLATRPDEALAQAIPATRAAPLEITFDSLMLLIAGVLAAGLGAYKGYGSDDPYPGYGKLERRYRKVRTEYDSAKAELRAELHGILGGLDAGLQDLREKAAGKIRTLEETLTNGEKRKESYDAQREEYEQSCRQDLIEYRAENMKARGGDIQPPCFKVFASMPHGLDVETLDAFPARLSAAKARFDALSQSLEEEEDKGAERMIAIERDLKEFLTELLNSSRERVETPPGGRLAGDEDEAE